MSPGQNAMLSIDTHRTLQFLQLPLLVLRQIVPDATIEYLSDSVVPDPGSGTMHVTHINKKGRAAGLCLGGTFIWSSHETKDSMRIAGSTSFLAWIAADNTHAFVAVAVVDVVIVGRTVCPCFGTTTLLSARES